MQEGNGVSIIVSRDYTITYIYTYLFIMFSNFYFVCVCVFFSIYISCDVETGDERDIIKLVQKCLNKSIAQRTISKQEVMCELARLPNNVICSDTIETVSLSGYTKLCNDSYNLAKTFLSKYKRRTEFLDYSLHQYFHVTKNKNKSQYKEIIPHYVGGSGQPTYPITVNYARIKLMKHRPWSSSLDLPDHDSIMARKGVYCRFLFCRTYICTEVFVLPNGNKSGVSGTIVGKIHWFC